MDMDNEREEKFINFIKELDKRSLTTTEVAKLYGYSGKKFNEILEEVGLIYKRKYKNKTSWIARKIVNEKGLQELQTQTYIKSDGEVQTFKKTPKWNKKGILYIFYLLANLDIYPLDNFDGLDKKNEIDQKIEQLSFLNIN